MDGSLKPKGQAVRPEDDEGEGEGNSSGDPGLAQEEVGPAPSQPPPPLSPLPDLLRPCRGGGRRGCAGLQQPPAARNRTATGDRACCKALPTLPSACAWRAHTQLVLKPNGTHACMVERHHDLLRGVLEDTLSS